MADSDLDRHNANRNLVAGALSRPNRDPYHPVVAAAIANHYLDETGGYSMRASTNEPYKIGTPNAVFVGGMPGTNGKPVDATVAPAADVHMGTILSESRRVKNATGGDSSAYSGGWNDSGTYYGDASERVADRETAYRKAYRQPGAQRGGKGIELGIFDGSTGEELGVKTPGRKNRDKRRAGKRG